MTPDTLLKQEELADAAFDLLTSSSFERYARMAKRAAARSQLHGDLKTAPEMIPRVVRRAKELWRTLRRSGQRDVPEIELAVLLAMLAQTSTPEVDELLVDLSLVDSPTVAWAGALARKLLHERAGNKELSMWHHHRETKKWDATNSAVADLKSEIPSEPNIECRREHASQEDITPVTV